MRFLKVISIASMTGLLSLCAAACSTDPSSDSSPATSAAPAAATAKAAPLTFARPDSLAAIASLETLTKLVAQGDPEARGFHSVDEVRTANAAAPLPLFMMGLDGLRAYHAGQDPHSLLIDEQSVMVPLTVGGEVRSAVVLKKRAGDVWEAASFGHKNLAKAAHSGRHAIFANRGIDEASAFVVRVPTLGARFIAHDENGKLMLTPMEDVADTTLHAGVTREAAEVLAVLQPKAMAARSDVPN